MVRLEVEGISILSRVTSRSREVLGLREGLPLFVQVKSVALDRNI